MPNLATLARKRMELSSRRIMRALMNRAHLRRNHRDRTSHQVRCDFRHLAPLALKEVHVGHPWLTLQAIAGVDEAVGVGVDVRVVDLSKVSDEDDLAPLPHPRDQ